MKPTIEQIKEVAEQFTDKYAVVAIRTQEETFDIGEVSHVSHVWVDGDDTGTEIEGLSATTITSNKITMHASDNDSYSSYWGDNVAIICGNDYSMGEDAGEVIITDPVCVHIF